MTRSLALVLLTAFACSAAACGGIGRAAGSEVSAVHGASSIRCPPRAAQRPVVRKVGPGKRLAHGGATVLLLCRYHGLNALKALGLARVRRVRSIGTINELTHELDSLWLRAQTTNACPMDDGSKILLLFGYRGRETERVVVGLRGCRVITNGRVGSLASLSHRGRRLVRQLKSLTSL